MTRMAAKVVINLNIAYSRSLAKDKVGAHYDSAGRVDCDLIRSFMAIPEAHYLLCGSTPFMADIQDALEAHDIPSEGIHTEAFGPSQ